MKRLRDLYRDPEDDAVTLGVKLLWSYTSTCLILWLVSFILIVLQITYDDSLFPLNFILFIPMWCGSLLGMISAIGLCRYVCGNATLVSRERRIFIRSQNILNDVDLIEYESMPLMRRLFCLNAVAGVTSLLTLIAQVLFYLWFSIHVINVWRALIPLGVLLAVALAYMYLVKFVTWRVCGVISLLVLQLVRICIIILHTT